MVAKKHSRKRTRTARTTARPGRAGAQEQLLSALHQVWLAGLGAAVKAQRGTPKLLDDLVAEGARFQQARQDLAERTVRRLIGDAQTRWRTGVGQVRGQANEALANLEKVFQLRVQRALGQLGVPSARELSSLGKRVDALSHSVDRLAQRPAPRSAPRRRTRTAPKTQASQRSAPSEPAAAP